MMALAVCSGEDSTVPWFDPSLECSELASEIASPIAAAWGDDSPCAGDSRTNRYRALDNGTVVACEPAAKFGAIWQNNHLAEVKGDKAVDQCRNLCKDPGAPDDPSRCSAFCKDANDASKCDPGLKALAWRLPDTAELETLKQVLNGNECTLQGCRMDAHFEGDCTSYWAAALEDPDDPLHSARAFTDMRGGVSGYDPVDLSHPVRCVADRL